MNPSTDGKSFFAPLFALTVVGLVLRVAAARGDLWLDEIWSLSLVRDLPSAAAVFGLHHDNNHYLNSLWMRAVGQNAPVLVYRLPADLFGMGSVPAAGLILRREGRAASFAAMALVATADVMVEFGSEARGYSGMIFFELLAILYAGRMLDGEGRTRRRASCKLAPCLALGLLCHFTMLLAAGGIALWVLLAQRAEGKTWAAASVAMFRLLMPSIALVGALAILLFAGGSSYSLGHSDPYDAVGFWRAYGALFLVLGGIAVIAPATCFLATALVFSGLAAELASGGRRVWLYSAFLIGVPLAYSCAGLPNSAIVRYFLPCGVAFLLWLAHRIGILSRQGSQPRAVAMLGLATILTLNAHMLAEFYRYGRGDYGDLLARMAVNGAIRYATDHRRETALVMDYYGSRLGIAAQAVPEADWCGGAANWFILTGTSTMSAEGLAEQISHDCGFALVREPFPAHSLSSLDWHVYRIDRR